MENTTTVLGSIRRLIIFQLKLLADAVRDLFLSPISIAVSILDVLFQLKGERSLFNKMLEMGVQSDHFINLFGQFGKDDTISALVEEVESSVVSHGSRPKKPDVDVQS